VAIAHVDDGQIVDWTERETRWDVLHNEGSEGSHHARIARFLTENGVQVVVAGHMGPPMSQMLGRMGVAVRLEDTRDPRAAALAAAATD
jgi:predicted Fe-Mo cluster-binding NifX family protein